MGELITTRWRTMTRRWLSYAIPPLTGSAQNDGLIRTELLLQQRAHFSHAYISPLVDS